MIRKVIFIDEDNTALAPFAAALFGKKAESMGEALEAESRGTVVLFPEPVNRRIAQIAAEYGINLDDHQARGLVESDFEPDVLMLALDRTSQKRAFDIHGGFSNIFILREYAGETGDIKIPLGEGDDKYEAVCETLDRLMDFLIDKFKDEEVAQ